MSKFIIKIAGNNMTEEQKDIVRSIDFDELKKGIDILKSYRGLTMVDIRSKDGTGVKIVIQAAKKHFIFSYTVFKILYLIQTHKNQYF